MQGGNFGDFNNWKPEEHALNKMIYDEARKKGGGPGGGKQNSGCATFLLVIFLALAGLIVFWQ